MKYSHRDMHQQSSQQGQNKYTAKVNSGKIVLNEKYRQ